MKPFHILFACAALCMMLLSGCSELFPKPGQNAVTPPVESKPVDEQLSVLPEGWDAEPEPIDYASVEQLVMTVTEKTIRELENYPNLKMLDLSGSTCYTAIMVYIQNHPEVDVTYTVDFGGADALNWTQNVILSADGVDFEKVRRNLVFLPNLQSVHFPMTRLTLEEIGILRAMYPDLTITYTAPYHGLELSEDTAQWNVAGISAADIDDLVFALNRLPNLDFVELMDSSGNCSLSRQEVKQLVEAAPDVRFHYTFNLFGRMVSTTDQRISYTGLNLNAGSESEIREALSIMAPGSTLILDRCGLSSELLASIRADYTNVDLVWRVFFGTEGRYSTLTNDDTIRCVYNVTDDTCYEMRYLRSVKYMDLGHNDTLTDLSFLGFMPELEICILSGCAASELTGIENCKKLEFLELANCLMLKDISALSGCSSLKYLNICYTKVSDLMPLDGLPIENLFCKQTRVSVEEQKEFKEIHEDCTAVFTGKDPYAGAGWRYTDNGYHYTDFYKRVREAFDYDSVDQALRAQEKANK